MKEPYTKLPVSIVAQMQTIPIYTSQLSQNCQITTASSTPFPVYYDGSSLLHFSRKPVQGLLKYLFTSLPFQLSGENDRNLLSPASNNLTTVQQQMTTNYFKLY